MFAFRTLGRSANTILTLLLSERRLKNSPFPIPSPNLVPPPRELEGFEFGGPISQKDGLISDPAQGAKPQWKNTTTDTVWSVTPAGCLIDSKNKGFINKTSEQYKPWKIHSDVVRIRTETYNSIQQLFSK